MERCGFRQAVDCHSSLWHRIRRRSRPARTPTRRVGGAGRCQPHPRLSSASPVARLGARTRLAALFLAGQSHLRPNRSKKQRWSHRSPLFRARHLGRALASCWKSLWSHTEITVAATSDQRIHEALADCHYLLFFFSCFASFFSLAVLVGCFLVSFLVSFVFIGLFVRPDLAMAGRW